MAEVLSESQVAGRQRSSGAEERLCHGAATDGIGWVRWVASRPTGWPYYRLRYAVAVAE